MESKAKIDDIIFKVTNNSNNNHIVEAAGFVIFLVVYINQALCFILLKYDFI